MNSKLLQPFLHGASGNVEIPGSKSITNRIILLAILSSSNLSIQHPLESEDSILMAKAAESLGAKIIKKEKSWDIFPAKKIFFIEKQLEIFLGNSGTSMRFLSAACSFLARGKIKLFGKSRMHERPTGELLTALQAIGIKICSEKKIGFPPVLISANGEIDGGKVKISGNISSQFLSAIFLIAPKTKQGIEIEIIPPVVSFGYLEMTIKILQKFGIKVSKISKNIFFIPPGNFLLPKTFTIEPDASSAAHVFSLAVAAGGEITIKNFPKNSLQPDVGFIKVLQKFGAKFSENSGGTKISMSGKIRPLGEINLEEMPDAALSAAVLAGIGKGKTKITGLQTLRKKECDRIAALEKNFQTLGISSRSGEDFLEIYGVEKQKIRPGKIETFDDHRIAMSFAAIGTVAAGIEIEDPNCVEKTFPNFWEIFENCRQ